MKIPIKRAVIAIVASLVLLALVAASLIVLMVVFEYPGGMPPSYKAVDHDTRLTPTAREARPIIQSLDRYYQAHGHCPQPSDGDLDEIRSNLPSGLIATSRGRYIEFRDTKAITGWSYYPADNDPTACQLWRKLGWDPALIWRRHGAETKWIFVPGDGSDEKAIDLDIGG
jgi:hypothetical protein